MTDDFERALRRALRVNDPGEDFAGRVISRLEESSERKPAPTARPGSRTLRAIRSRWLPAALAACIIAAVGVIQMRRHALDAERANQARAQLLQALRIASDDVNIVRAAVARAENPDS